MNPLNAPIIANTIVQLAQIATYAFLIHAIKSVIIHYFNKRTCPMFPPRTPEEIQIDEARVSGIDSDYHDDDVDEGVVKH